MKETGKNLETGPTSGWFRERENEDKYSQINLNLSYLLRNGESEEFPFFSQLEIALGMPSRARISSPKNPAGTNLRTLDQTENWTMPRSSIAFFRLELNVKSKRQFRSVCHSFVAQNVKCQILILDSISKTLALLGTRDLWPRKVWGHQNCRIEGREGFI